MSKLCIFDKLRDWSRFRTTLKGSLGFVPTMGALHQGHTSLVSKSVSENDLTLVSIYLNPTQFNDKNDLNNYPKTLDEDILKLEDAGCDFLLLPNYSEVYPDNYAFKVVENNLSQSLCGSTRKGHFDGVLTIVMKLLNIANSDRAYFGKKDFQQYLLIKQMVEAFFMPTQIIGCETIRDVDGLALSSRNSLLSKKQRSVAPKMFKTITDVKNIEMAKQILEDNNFEVDYLEDKLGRRFVAAVLGDVRLIDNVEI